MHKTHPLVSGSSDSNVGIVSLDDVERSPILALTEILQVNDLLPVSVVFLVVLSAVKTWESVKLPLSDTESSSPSTLLSSICCFSVVPFSSVASWADEVCAVGSMSYIKIKGKNMPLVDSWN